MERFELKEGIEYIKIHGLQRSGTNYLSYLIRENLEEAETLTNVGGWKHGYYCAPWVLGQEVHVVTIVKNPFAWLVSLYNYWGPKKRHNVGPDLTNVSFDEFIRNESIFEQSDGVPFLYKTKNPIQHWNGMYFHWNSIRMNFKKSIVISYQNLIEDGEMIIDYLGDLFSLKRKPGPFKTCSNTILPGNEDIVIDDSQWEEKEYYLEAKYMAYYNENSLKFVMSELDLPLVQSLGYKIVKG